jgi:tetratricopeptide (TPR) repeat protein
MRHRRYNRSMLLRAALIILVLSTMAQAQTEPLFLDSRPGENPAVIDVTEISGTYAKVAVREYEKGVSDARKGNRDGALKHLEEAIKIEPDFFNAHNSLAILYQYMSRYRDGEREYMEALRINPRSVAPLVNLASLYIEEAFSYADSDPRTSRAKLNDALARLNQALAAQPGNPSAYYYTGVVYYLTSFFEESESYFKKALESGDRRMKPARLALADIYVRLREWDSVVVQLEAYLKEVPWASNRKTVLHVRDVAVRNLNAPRK